MVAMSPRVISARVRSTGTFLLSLAALLMCLGLAGVYLESGSAGIAQLATSRWNILLISLTAGPGLVLFLAGNLTEGDLIRRIKRPSAAAEAEKPLSPPEAMHIVQSFSAHLRDYSCRQQQFLDVSVLPYPKARIEQAIFALLVNANLAEKNALCDGLVVLAFYQEGLDPKGADAEQLAAAYNRLKFANDETLEKLAAGPNAITSWKPCANQLKQLRDADVARYEKLWEKTVYPRRTRRQPHMSHDCSLG